MKHSFSHSNEAGQNCMLLSAASLCTVSATSSLPKCCPKYLKSQKALLSSIQFQCICLAPKNDTNSWLHSHHQGRSQRIVAAMLSCCIVPYVLYHILFYPIPSHSILSHLILFCPILSYPILSYPILSFPILNSNYECRTLIRKVKYIQ